MYVPLWNPSLIKPYGVEVEPWAKEGEANPM